MTVNGRVGIIGCYALADEIIYLLHRDNDITDVYVVFNPEGERFLEKLNKGSVHFRTSTVRSEDLGTIRDRGGFSIVVWLNPPNLHDEPSVLGKTLAHSAVVMSEFVDSILIAYGRCRVPPELLNPLLDLLDVPVTFLTDVEGRVVDDCLAAVLGGRTAYLNAIKRNKHTLFVTTGYAENWNRKFEDLDIVPLLDEVDNLKSVLELLDYKRILKLETKVGNEQEFDDRVRAFSIVFDLEVDSVGCELSVFDLSYHKAKGKVSEKDESLPAQILTERMLY